MADLKEESHPHLIRREMLNMIKKPGFITFQFYIHRRYFYLKKGKKKRKERRGEKKKSLSSLLFVEDCVDDWKTSIIQVSQAPEVFQYLRDS